MTAEKPRKYSYLGPAGTFTEAALRQVPEATGQVWQPVVNVSQALRNVTTGVSDAAMIAIENSIDGGVSATQDALASFGNLQIYGEYLVPVDFVLVSRPEVQLSEVTTIAAHPVAYAQCRSWLEQHLPEHQHIPASSNAQAAADLFAEGTVIDAALAPPTITEHFELAVHGSELVDNPGAQTRFVLVGKPRPAGQPTGHDKTSLIIDLPEEKAGALLTLLEQFAARGVNLTQIASRPIGHHMGSYRFFIDAEGHIRDARLRHAVMGVKQYSPRVTFLGSYPRADRVQPKVDPNHTDAAFADAEAWVAGLIAGN